MSVERIQSHDKAFTDGYAVTIDKSYIRLIGRDWTRMHVEVNGVRVGKLYFADGETTVTLFSDRPAEYGNVTDLVALALRTMGFPGVRFDPKQILTLAL